jgi:hypothetical protein
VWSIPPSVLSCRERSQDDAGVQARKLVVDGKRLPWLVGLAPCDTAPKRFYSRGYMTESTDTREWSVEKAAVDTVDRQRSGDGGSAADTEYTIKSVSTGRCLTMDSAGTSPDTDTTNNNKNDIGALAAGAQQVVLMPCNASSPAQRWSFGKGLHSPSSMYSASAPALALTIGNDTLFSASYGKDPHMVPSAAYGDTTLGFTPRADQEGCSSRDCQNYDDKQMWYYDPTEQLLRATT